MISTRGSKDGRVLACVSLNTRSCRQDSNGGVRPHLRQPHSTRATNGKVMPSQGGVEAFHYVCPARRCGHILGCIPPKEPAWSVCRKPCSASDGVGAARPDLKPQARACRSYRAQGHSQRVEGLVEGIASSRLCRLTRSLALLRVKRPTQPGALCPRPPVARRQRTHSRSAPSSASQQAGSLSSRTNRPNSKPRRPSRNSTTVPTPGRSIVKLRS